MKAIVRTKYGSPDILELKDVEPPVPNDNQVLINVRAASVNPYDWHVLRGKPFLVRLMGFGFLKPKHQILGADVAGRVEAVGKNVTRLKVGDDVFGSSIGSFAEYACLRENRLAVKPEAITFEQAAAVPIAGLTALQGLRDHGKLQPGQHVLINGASGGVGTFAVQIAKAMGAHVTGVCSGKNLELVKSIGADQAIDYTREKFWRLGMKFDVILDCVANGSVPKSMRVLNPAGIYVPVGGSISSFLQASILKPLYSKKSGRRIASILANINTADLAFLGELLATGKVVPVVDRKYELSETAQAIRYVEEGHARGKVIIVVRE